MSAGAVALDLPGAARSQLRLPPLREDLQLLPEAAQVGSTPSWSLYDPVRHAFFRIGWQEFEILSRWHLGRADEVAQEVNVSTSLRVTDGDIAGVERFLVANQLVQQATGTGFADRLAAGRPRFMAKIVADYLYRRFPLFRPDRFLSASQHLFSFCFRPFFWKLTLLIGLVGLYLAARQWQVFLHTFLYLFTLPGILFFSVTMTLVKLIHELAHAYTAKHFGLKVPIMGIAFLIVWPLFYTDTTDAWRLADKKKRMDIGVAGVLAELAIAAYATFLWNFFEPGPIKSTLFLLASATWLASLAVNLNPFMRFDGYYLLSDHWDISNLQPRAFGLARWFVRKSVLGVQDPCPEQLEKSRRRLLLLYGFGTWIYRLIVFTSIALMVYHLAFKILGIFLLALELAWFIGLPVLREMGSWWQLRGRVRALNLFTSLLIAGTVIFMLVVPWQGAVYAPAVYQYGQAFRLYAPESGQLAEIKVKQGQEVQKGELLFILRSPELDYLEAQARRQAEKLKLELRRAGFAQEKAEYLQVLEQQLTGALTALAGLREQKERLLIRAPISGTVIEVLENLENGQAVNPSLQLALLVNEATPRVEGYLQERDLSRVLAGGRGVFYPEHTELAPIEGALQGIDATHTEQLEEAALASVYGGPLPVRVTAGGKLMNEESVYRFLLRPAPDSARPVRLLRGTVRLEGKPLSVLARSWLAVRRVLIRESDF